MAKFDICGLLRDCYMHAEPSIDLSKLPEGVKVKCTDHKLRMSVYNALLRKWGVTDENDQPVDPDLHFGVQFFMMDKGPSWVDDISAMQQEIINLKAA